MAQAPCDNNADTVEVIYAPGVRCAWILDSTRFSAAEPNPVSSRVLAATTLEIEQTIASVIEEHSDGLARVVYTFGGRDIHLRDGSRIEFRWQLAVSDWRCLDCDIDTDAINEYYMLRDEVWQQAHPDIDGQLCIGCVEQRLGRKLAATDFTAQTINTSTTLQRSTRLSDRLGNQP